MTPNCLKILLIAKKAYINSYVLEWVSKKGNFEIKEGLTRTGWGRSREDYEPEKTSPGRRNRM